MANLTLKRTRSGMPLRAAQLKRKAQSRCAVRSLH
jgi:hypothetical protein